MGGGRTDYWYDATGLSREYEAATGTGQTGGRGETLFTRSPGGGLLSIKTGGATRNYGTDRQGSVTALTGTDGSLDATYRYDPWGSSNGATGTAYNPYRYTGTYFDSASDLYQMGARYYQAKSGRFTQTDPAGVETYGYGYGNPVNYTDRDGLTADPIETGGGPGPSPLSNVGPGGLIDPYKTAGVALHGSGDSSVSLYRAVSEAELADIQQYGGFRAGGGQYEGKLFATSEADAASWGTELYGEQPHHIVQATIPSSYEQQLYPGWADGRPYLYVDRNQFDEFNAQASITVIR